MKGQVKAKKERAISREIDIELLPQPDVVRFRTDAGKLREQGRRVFGEVECRRAEIDFERFLAELDELDGYSRSLRKFASQFVKA